MVNVPGMDGVTMVTNVTFGVAKVMGVAEVWVVMAGERVGREAGCVLLGGGRLLHKGVEEALKVVAVRVVQECCGGDRFHVEDQ